MKKYLIYLMAVLIVSCSQRQTKDSVEDADAVFVEVKEEIKGNALFGTIIIVGTDNQYAAERYYGVYFAELTKSDCQNDGEKFQDHINSILLTDSTLIIDFNTYRNCCVDFLCDISVDDEGILNLIYIAYGNTTCMCNCCLGLTYHLDILDRKLFRKIKTVMINGDRKTIKSIN